MYNIFKRPMFKLGGQADQGSGIMSTVEPRQNYMFGNIAQPLTPFQNTYTELPAYAYGGRIGYANGPGPVMPLPFGMSPVTLPKAGEKITPGDLPTVSETDIMRRRRLFDEEQKAAQAKRREELGITTLAERRPVSDDEATIKRLISEGYFGTDAKGNVITTPTAAQQQRALAKVKTQEEATDRKFGLDKETGDFATGLGEQKIKTKKPTNTETTTTDPRDAIRKEAAVLKDLLKDEGLTTAENAFIIAKALATPGGFNAKVAAAANLAMPIIKERSKLDRDVTLEAYKTSKEMEKARIAAGKLDPAAKFTEDYVSNAINIARETKDGVITGEDGLTRYKVGNEYKTRAEIERDFLNIRGGIVPPAMRAELSNTILNSQKQIENLRKQKQTDEVRAQIASKEADINRARSMLRGEFKTGGRVQKQFGGMMDTTEDATVKEAEETNTVIDTNVAGTPMKPVQKLTYEQIRDRLPQEITDDIVKLIANSAEALQDFAYIKTQQDVNQFNIKYGVNLVLPQGA